MAEAKDEGKREIRIRDDGVHTLYSNFFTVSGNRDAASIGFGSIFGNANNAQMEGKIALSWPNAKRLAMSLGQLIRNYEEQNGEIEVGLPNQNAPVQDNPSTDESDD
jgi:hypothetical protein